MFSGRDLMKVAIEKLPPDQLAKLAEDAEIKFRVGVEWYVFQEGDLRSVNGNAPANAGLSAITGVSYEGVLMGREENLKAAGVSNVQDRAPRTVPLDSVRASANAPLQAKETVPQSEPDKAPLVVPLEPLGGANPKNVSEGPIGTAKPGSTGTLPLKT